MSSEVFESVEEELKSVVGDVRRKINEQVPRLHGEERKKVVREVERLFEDADSLLDEIDLEVPKAPQPYRQQMNTKVRKYRDELKKLSSELKSMKEMSNSSFARQELFAAQDGSAAQDLISGQRSRLYQGNQVLDRTSQSIARSNRVAIETEEIGHEIISEMGQQRESLLRTQTTLHGTDANLIQSRKILKSMYMRVMTNKLILMVIILMEIAILIGIVYWKFIR